MYLFTRLEKLGCTTYLLDKYNIKKNYSSDAFKVTSSTKINYRTKENRTITIPQTVQEEDDDMYSFEDDTNLELETNSNTDVTEYFNSSVVKSSRFY